MTRQIKSPLGKTALAQLSRAERELVLLSKDLAYSQDYDLFTKKFTASSKRGLGILTKAEKWSNLRVLGTKAGFLVPTQGIMMKGLLHRGIRHIIDTLADCPCDASYNEISGLLSVWQTLWTNCQDKDTKGLGKTIYARKLGGPETLNKLIGIQVEIAINKGDCFRVVFTHGRKEVVLELNEELAYPIWALA